MIKIRRREKRETTSSFIDDDLGSGTFSEDIEAFLTSNSVVSFSTPATPITPMQSVAMTTLVTVTDMPMTSLPARLPTTIVTTSSGLQATTLSSQLASSTSVGIVPVDSFDQNTVELLFIFILVSISFVLLIAIALTLLIGVCLWRRKRLPSSKPLIGGGGVKGGAKEENLSLSSYSGKFEVVRPNTLRSITAQTCEASTFGFPEITVSEATQPQELISYDVPTSLLPIAPPPAQVTPRNSTRVSVYPPETADHGSDDYDDVDGCEEEKEYEITDYIEPFDTLNHTSWYSSSLTDPAQSPPPTPPERFHSIAGRTISNVSDFVDDDHIYTEPLEPSMLSRNRSPCKKGLEGLPYAPIYDISMPIKKIRNVYHASPKSIRVIQELGRGHFGKVYLAATIDISLKDLKLSDDADTSRSLLVAIKQLKITADSNLQEAFQKEVRFMSQLRHPNVARLLAVSDGGTPFIMMEYMENGDLNEFLRKQHIQPDTVPFLEENEVTPLILLYIAVQIASGMKYLASRKFVHRDLATRNCLVGRDFVTKISDFGMSRNIYETSYYRVGSHLILPIRWMATETFYGKFSVKSDAWAFGVTMWELYTLCSCVPFTGISDDDVIADALRGDDRQILHKPSDCPVDVYSVMLRCFEHRTLLRADFEEIYARLFVAYSNLGRTNVIDSA